MHKRLSAKRVSFFSPEAPPIPTLMNEKIKNNDKEL
jgi:hypothetical protein